MEGLPRDAVEVETRAIELVSGQAEQLIQEYLRRFGVVVSTDHARELFPDYAASLESKLRYAGAVQHSAAYISDMVFGQVLQGEPGGNALFTAGGTGAGKTSAILQNIETGQAMAGARVIYDSNFNSFKSALAKVELALKAECTVSVIFVHRNPVEAYLEGVLPRALEQGRTVSIQGHLRMHKDSRGTFLKMQRRLQGNEKVAFTVLSNAGHESEVFKADVDYLRAVTYDDDAVCAVIRKGLDDAYTEGKIPQSLYEISRGGL
jgi:hypothetical protein